MKVEVTLPQMGESVVEGTIIKWWKNPGDRIERDETLFEVSTDKVDSEIPTPAAGTVVEILYPEGSTIEINTIIAYIETEADKAEVKETPVVSAPVVEQAKQEDEKPAPAEIKPEPAAEKVLPKTAPVISSSDGSKKGFYSPVVLRIAGTEGIPIEALGTLEGSGLGGRVTKKDVLANLEKLKSAASKPAVAPTAPAPAVEPAKPAIQKAAPAPEIDYTDEGIRVVPMSNMRQKIAEHMVRSVKTSPHVTSVTEVDLTNIVRYRRKENAAFVEREGIKLTYTAFIVRAVVMAVQEFPEINASVEGNNIIYRKNINAGIAVALENGLIVPVIKNAEEKNLVGLARAIYDLGTRARTKKLKPDDVQGVTISLTNPGIYGTLFGTPIINQPNVAIIGVGAIKKRPMVVNDAIAIRDMMYLTVTYDHRLIDGALAARFLQRVVEFLENVDSLL